MQDCSFLPGSLHVSIFCIRIQFGKSCIERRRKKERHGYFELVGTEVLDKMSSRGPYQAQLFSVILLQAHKCICTEECASPSLGFLAPLSLQSPYPGRGVLWSDL